MSNSTLPQLDSSLYPQVWQQGIFADPQSLLIAMLTGLITPDPYDFAKQLQANDTYQEWINSSIFGRYIQHNFAAIYNQSEDSFNMDIPALFRKELLRHGQYLPLEQILFVAGSMPKNVRHEKFFTTTINPATVIVGAQKLRQNTHKPISINTQELIINQIQIKGRQVLGFPIRHNKRTSERIRNEILIMGFDNLRLVDERTLYNDNNNDNEQSSTGNPIVLRCYELR